VEENFGGPVWHASGRGRTLPGSRQIVRDGLRGVGDASLGEWQFDGEKAGVVHLQRRLSDAEREEFGVPEPYDIRGTYEEHRRIAAVYREAPYLHHGDAVNARDAANPPEWYQEWPCGCVVGYTEHGIGWSDCQYTQEQKRQQRQRAHLDELTRLSEEVEGGYT